MYYKYIKLENLFILNKPKILKPPSSSNIMSQDELVHVQMKTELFRHNSLLLNLKIHSSQHNISHIMESLLSHSDFSSIK